MEKVTTSDNVRQHGVLVCKHCKTLWQRDVLASKNLFWIAKSVIAGYGRPFPFLRPTQDTSTHSDANQRTNHCYECRFSRKRDLDILRMAVSCNCIFISKPNNSVA